MKILCLRAYYEPEQTAGTHLMKDLEECIISEHSIEYIVSTPTRGVSDEVRRYYKRKRIEKKYNGKIVVKRFPMYKEGKSPVTRAIRYLCCGIAQIYLGSRSENIDLILSGSTPPTIGVYCVVLGKILSKKQHKKIPIIYKIDDIFPDSLVQAGLTKEGSIIWKIGRRMEDYIYKNTDILIVINQRMKDNLLRKGVLDTKIEVISNWIDFENVVPVNKKQNRLFDELRISREKYNILYAGNIGEAQGAEIIIEVAKKLKDVDSINFVVFGGGANFIDFRNKASDLDNIQVFDLMPLDRVSEVYSVADIALITCKPGFGNIGMPSKTWSIMACNKQIIASYDLNSVLESVINECNAGVVVEPGNTDALAHIILETFNNRFEENNSTTNIREIAMKMASKDYCTGRYLDVINMFA